MALTPDDTFRVLKRRDFAYIIGCISKRSRDMNTDHVIRAWACWSKNSKRLPDIQEWFRELLDQSGWTLDEFAQECLRQYHE